MDDRLQKALEKHGLPPGSSETAAQSFYAHMSLDEKGKLGVELGQEAYHQDQEPLSTRNESIQQRDITTRAFQVRSQTANEEERSVEAVISTDQPVEVWDWRRGEMINEVLLADAARIPSQMPMLANHDRWSLDSVLGSIRNIRADGGNVIGKLFFARDDADSEKAWNKVRQAHIVDVSVGYRVNEATEIQAGQTAVIKGRSFTAGKSALRVVTDWTPKEGSLVPIGADQAAKIREDNSINQTRKEGSTVNPKLRAFLESLGLRKDASEADAKAFYAGLKAEDKARADAACVETPAPAPVPEPNRADPPTVPQAPTVDQAEVASRAVAAERDRVRNIRELAGADVPEAIREQAISEGWDITRANREFLTAVRETRAAGVGPAIHVNSSERNTSVRSLAAGLLASQGLDPTKHRMHDGRRDPGRADAIVEQDADRGDRFRGMSAFDIMRECVRLDTGRWCNSPSECFEAARTAPSGGALSYVFTTNVYAKLLQGWETVGDTTVGWCDEEDVPNFLEQEDISLTATARLKKLPRGGTADHAKVSDSHETYKIARYANQFVADEQDVIDDRLGAIMRMPVEMGEAARNIRPDLVYSLLLENGTMADTGAVFNATAVTTAGGHANLGTAVLGNDGLKAAITAMVMQRINRTTADPGRALTIRPRFLIVPAALEWTARGLTSAAALSKLFADSSDPWYAQLNLLAQEGLRVVVDDRVGAIGVVDPRDETVRTGLDTNWFLAQGGSRGVRVAYRRGTNRQPVLRSFTLDKGQWGIGWDINLDIGGVTNEWKTLYKSTGAGG